MYVVLERNTVFAHLERRDYIRYLDLRTGMPTPGCRIGLTNHLVRGEMIRGRESVWVGDEGRPNGLSPEFLLPGNVFTAW